MILVALLSAAWLVWRKIEVTEGAAPVAPKTPSVAASGASTETPTSLDSADLAREPIEAPLPAAPAQEPIALGTIVVLDENGEEHSRESGSFMLLVPTSGTASIPVTVKEGTWTQPLPEGATFFVNRIVLGGRAAVALPSSGAFLAGAHALQLRCQWAAVARLHVVDDVRGAELDGIRLYSVRAFDALGIDVMLQRPKTGLIGEDLYSPIEIRYVPAENEPGTPMHFAHRTGYVWGHIQIDPTSGGDFMLRLQPGGDLHVAVEGAKADSRLGCGSIASMRRT